jgi:Flp pilus assembly protein CpaB
LLIFIILVLVLVLGSIAFWRLRGGAPDGDEGEERAVELPLITGPQATPEVETERVVVALQTVPRGMRVPPDAIEIREWPVDDPDYPRDPVFRLSAVVGKMARVDIPRQRPLSMDMLAELTLGEGSELALAIPKGKVAFALPVRVMSAVANTIRPSDRVDVLVSFSVIEVDEDSQIKKPVFFTGGDELLAAPQPTGEQIPRIVSQYTVQNAQVLAVDLWEEALPEVIQPAEEGETPEGEESAPPVAAPSVASAMITLTSVTLVVSPQDALVLKWALENDASIDLAMRSAVDQDIYAQPEAVTLQYMLDRFQVSVPTKLPHAVTSGEFERRLLDEARGGLPVGGE